MRLRIGTIAALLAFFSAVMPARADDAEERAKEAVKYFDKYSKKLKDEFKYAELISELTSHQHPVTAERVGKVLLKEKNVERQMMAASALSEFKDNDACRDAAGEALVKAVTGKKDLDPDVLDTCVDSIGKLPYADGVPALIEVLEKLNQDPWVMVTSVRSLGRIKDWRGLPILLTLWEKCGSVYKWTTGEVKVDTGASGDVDQKEAEKQWNQKYGMRQGKGKPPLLFKAYVQELAKAVAEITGEKMESPDQLRKWMDERAEKFAELGIEIPEYRGPKKPDEEDEERGKGEGKSKRK